MISPAPSLAPLLPSLSPLRRVDRVEGASRALSHYINAAALQPGDRLPAERDLMKSLAVGRSTVREVIRQFQALGILEARKGSGTYLRRVVSVDAIHIPLVIETADLRDRLSQTLEVRRGLEIEASAAAARRATPEDLKTIEARLDAMEAVQLQKGTFGREDLAFRLAIYDASGNPLFRQLLEGIRAGFELASDKPPDRSNLAKRSFPFYRELFDAIRKGDEKKARKKTRQILAIVEEDIKNSPR